ncbi:MAG: SsrA-binding protein SmpB [Planctomycetota bacterium]|nr:SsrA-binding protein SmpB [Planctomycetota bacterium]
MSKSAREESPENNRPICTNRKAKHNYEILSELECGVMLQGSEVKSIRSGKVSLDEAYARMREGALWLLSCDIAVYPQASILNHEPRRPRKLLLHRRELRKFAEQADHKGLTLIPLSMYIKQGKIKVAVAVARGKKLHDKRETLKKTEAQREIQRAMQRKR